MDRRGELLVPPLGDQRTDQQVADSVGVLLVARLWQLSAQRTDLRLVGLVPARGRAFWVMGWGPRTDRRRPCVPTQELQPAHPASRNRQTDQRPALVLPEVRLLARALLVPRKDRPRVPVAQEQETWLELWVLTWGHWVPRVDRRQAAQV
jgi:hypothetical protein